MNSVESSPEIMGGTPVFAGTRVPVETLMDYVEAGDSIDEFLGDFPTVSWEKVVETLKIVGVIFRVQSRSENLLDECLPRRLAGEFMGHEVKTVPQIGWASIKNGELLKRAESHFDVFVTADRNLSFQQNLAPRKIAVVVLHASSNRFQDLLPLVAENSRGADDDQSW